MRSLKAVPVVAAGFLVGVLPALAGVSHTVDGTGGAWNPSTVTAETGDDVTFTWVGSHNVSFEDGSGSATSGFNKSFDTAGSFKFRCTIHSTDFDSGMVGVVNVTQSTGTTGTDTTGTGTTPTDTTTTTGTTPTTTTPTTTTPTATTEADTTPPAITLLRRRSSRRALIVTFRSSEAGSVAATIRRRPPRAREFRVVGRRDAAMKQGANVVTLQRASRGLRRGAYRLSLVFADDAGNETGTRTIRFKIA